MKPTTLLFALTALPLAVACGDSDTNPADGDGDTTGSGAGSATTATGATTGTGGDPGPGPTRATIEGDVTWQVTFDDAAKMAGAVDCSYTRHYVGVEDASRPWVCPGCEVVFRADVEMTQGLDDCYLAHVSPDQPFEEEWIGYGNGVYYRGIGPMGEQGFAVVASDAVTTTHAVTALDAPAGGTMNFAISGAFTLVQVDGDPMHGFTPPATYACGWPKANPPAYTGDYTIAVGQPVPDGLFKDRCDETVRLHDFAGAYLLIEMGARDCPPCQALAQDEEAFVQGLAAQGITVHVITLMAPSLADPLGNTTTNMLETWTNNYGLSSPVLADRAWGLTMFIPLFGDMVGYPSMVLVDPNLNVMQFQSGFGSFDEIEAAIVADAN